MSSVELQLLFNEHIAGLSKNEQLRLASRILQVAAEREDEQETEEAAAEILRRQKEALKPMCGMFTGLESDASIRHDEILYGQ